MSPPEHGRRISGATRGGIEGDGLDGHSSFHWGVVRLPALVGALRRPKDRDEPSSFHMSFVLCLKNLPSTTNQTIQQTIAAGRLHVQHCTTLRPLRSRRFCSLDITLLHLNGTRRPILAISFRHAPLSFHLRLALFICLPTTYNGS